MERQYKYMALFFYSISLVYGSLIAIEDDSFKELLQGFIMNFYGIKREILNKIFDIKHSKEKGYYYRIDYDRVSKYGSLYWTNPKAFVEIYDEIGYEDTEEISRLAELFWWYVNEVNDMNNSNKTKH